MTINPTTQGVTMKVRKDDVIGTTDGRYGKVVSVDGNQVVVQEFADINEPDAEQPAEFAITSSQVASIR
jgi:hypothetical protein